MYRCFACDNPSPQHHADCVMTDRSSEKERKRSQDYWRQANTRPKDYGSEYKINIASGEDVVLEEAACT